jgi:hypothetical protein
LLRSGPGLLVLGYLPARQPPTKYIGEWEVAGTAHYDTYGLVESMADTGNGTADVKTFDTMINPVSGFRRRSHQLPRPAQCGGAYL